MRLSLLLQAVCFFLITGCAADDPLGEVSLSLVGSAPSGTTYRLRDADLTVRGPGETRVYDTEDAPDRTTIAARLPAGPYALDLAPGWRLERLLPGGNAETVRAELLTPSPLAFEIAAGTFTAVTLRFRVGAEDVDLGEGDLGVSIGVEEPDAGAPDAGAPDAGAPDAGAADPAILVSPGALTVTEGAQAHLTVRLAAAPSAPVAVAVTTSDPRVAQPFATQLFFDAATWNRPQSVFVATFEDADAADSAATLRFATGSRATEVAVQAIDGNVQALRVECYCGNGIYEGETRAFAVRPHFQPTREMTVTVASSDPTRLVVTPPVLVFTPSNYLVEQTFTVATGQDLDVTTDTVTLDVASPGGPSRSIPFQVMEPATDIYFGHGRNGYPATTAPLDANRVYAFSADIEGARAVIDRLQVYAAATSRARMALYADAGGRPGTLLGETDVFPLLADPSWPLAATTRQMAPRPLLGPGTYWIALVLESPTAVGRADEYFENIECSQPMPFQGAFPADPAGFTCGTALATSVMMAGRYMWQ